MLRRVQQGGVDQQRAVNVRMAAHIAADQPDRLRLERAPDPAWQVLAQAFRPGAQLRPALEHGFLIEQRVLRGQYYTQQQ